MSGIIEGRRWIETRLRFLEAQRAAGPPEEQLQAIDAEIEKLRAEASRHRGGLWRWLLARRRPHDL